MKRAVLLKEGVRSWWVYRATGGEVGGWAFYRDAMTAAFETACKGEDADGNFRYGPVTVRDARGNEGQLLPDGSVRLRDDAGEVVRVLDPLGREVA